MRPVALTARTEIVAFAVQSSAAAMPWITFHSRRGHVDLLNELVVARMVRRENLGNLGEVHTRKGSLSCSMKVPKFAGSSSESPLLAPLSNCCRGCC
jgi:hypothetical protein